MYCKHCGSKLDAEAIFCEECGTKTILSNNNQITASDTNTEKIFSDSNDVQIIENVDNRRKQLKFKYIAITIGVIAIAVILLMVYFTQKTSGKKSKNAYGLHVSANTDLASEAADVFLNKISYQGAYDFSWGYALKNGYNSSDNEIYFYFDNIQISSSQYDKDLEAGRLKITYDCYAKNGEKITKQILESLDTEWYATDYGEYYEFTYSDTLARS